jgi:heavy metal sensor kinase
VRRLRRLPIRVRLTLAFATVMAAVLAATGLFLYLRFGAELDATINQGLRSRAADVTALVRQADSGLAEAGRSPLTERGESIAQIVDPAGRVVDAPPLLRSFPLLTPRQVARARARTIIVRRGGVPGDDAPLRLLATPVRAQGRRLVVVVGAPLDNRRDALRNLAVLLLVGGPAALALASLAGYGVAAGALRPVEAMRVRAAEIPAVDPGERLPVPATEDELARLGETLNAMLGRVQQAFERECRFVADASHELRTPLANLKTELEVTLRRRRPAPELELILRSALEEVERVSRLAEDLLLIARSDRSAQPVQPGRVDAAALLDACARRFERRAVQAGMELRTDAPPELDLVADGLRLEQAVGNLLDNAIRHGAGGVELIAARAGDRVELHVRDSGPGFSDAVLDHAFERFARGDPARGRGGAGLGLAIVAAIADAHGGVAQAANRAEGGADVWLSLPLEPLPAVSARD